MSKKIIYLLSLLMALSLVFASCKKNNPLNSVGGDLIEEGDNTQNAGDDGLFTNFADIPKTEEPLITHKVFNLNGAVTFRNSVMVPMGEKGNYIAVFSEKRYESTKADNDIALDGETATDIVYNLNPKSGQTNYWKGETIIGDSAQGGDATKSHAAIVVFKVANDKVVIVSSYGAGISRIGKTYAERTPQSGLQYIVGTLDTQNDKINFNGGWKDVKVSGDKLVADAIKELNFKDTQTSQVQFLQFGTHSARGFVDTASGTKLVLPIIVANQGKTGGATESMGNIILTGTFSGSDVNSWELGDKVAFEQSSKAGWTKQKESIIYDVSGSTIKYLTVPNGSAGTENQYLFFGTAGNIPTTTGIPAGDGSPGLVQLKWYGSQNYTVAEYSKQPADNMLLMHVRNTERNLYINLLSGKDFTGSESGLRKVLINERGKASSIDVLPDGTIITLAEEGLASGTANERKFNVVFKRYSQAYLDSILK